MNPKIIMVIAAVAVLLTVGFFSGVLPGLGITVEVNTVSRNVGGFSGNKVNELIPQKGFICSWSSTEWGEAITVAGSVSIDAYALGLLDDVRYVVYLKKDQFSDWEIVSDSGIFKTYRSEYISAINPGPVGGSGWHIGGTFNCEPYIFRVRGNDYANGAVKVELYGHINENPLEFWRTAEWEKIATDEAYLYSGWGGLYRPLDAEGLPRSTFEIGEHVSIRVETSYGAMASETGKTWRVVLRNPSGVVHKEQDYGDNVKSTFEFDVTSDMYVKGGDNKWQLEIYNVVIGKGQLPIDTIDFLAKAPSDVTITGGSQTKVGNAMVLNLEAIVNAETQEAIDYFRVSAIYGVADVLLPNDPLDVQWIFSPVELTPTKSGNTYTYTLSVTPKYESYVTVHAKAVDTMGRASPHTTVYEFWAYADNPAREEDLEDSTGEGYDWGGHTNFWYPPVEPTGEGSFANYLPLIIAIAVFIIMLIIAFIPQIPIPYGMFGRMLVVVLGAVLAALIYWYMGGAF